MYRPKQMWTITGLTVSVQNIISELLTTFIALGSSKTLIQVTAGLSQVWAKNTSDHTLPFRALCVNLQIRIWKCKQIKLMSDVAWIPLVFLCCQKNRWS